MPTKLTQENLIKISQNHYLNTDNFNMKNCDHQMFWPVFDTGIYEVPNTKDFELPFIILSNHYTDEECNKFIDFYNNYKKENELISAAVGTSNVQDTSIRDAKNVFIENELQDFYYSKFEPIREIINTKYCTKLIDKPVLLYLGYEKDGHYIAHNDSCQNYPDGTFKYDYTDRKFTVLSILTNQVETEDELNNYDTHIGGSLEFTRIVSVVNSEEETIKYKLKKGDVLIFPSTPFYEHKVHKVLDGIRATMVQWWDAEILKKEK